MMPEASKNRAYQQAELFGNSHSSRISLIYWAFQPSYAFCLDSNATVST